MSVRGTLTSLLCALLLGACGGSSPTRETSNDDTGNPDTSTPTDTTNPTQPSDPVPTDPIPTDPIPTEPVPVDPVPVDPVGDLVTLTVSVPAGTFNVTPDPISSNGSVLTYERDTAVTITAVSSDTTLGFVGWTGAISTYHNPVMVFLSADATAITASFASAKFVSTTGSDSNDGTSLHPYKTLRYALSKATSGTEVHVEAGEYTVGTSPLMMVAGVSLRGGYSVGFTERRFTSAADRENDSYKTVITDTLMTMPGGVRAPIVFDSADFTRSTVIEGFTITTTSYGDTTLAITNGSPTVQFNTLLASVTYTDLSIALACTSCGAKVANNLIKTVSDGVSTSTRLSLVSAYSPNQLEMRGNDFQVELFSSLRSVFAITVREVGSATIADNNIQVDSSSVTRAQPLDLEPIEARDLTQVTISGNHVETPSISVSGANLALRGILAAGCTERAFVTNNVVTVGPVTVVKTATATASFRPEILGVAVTTSVDAKISGNQIRLAQTDFDAQAAMAVEVRAVDFDQNTASPSGVTSNVITVDPMQLAGILNLSTYGIYVYVDPSFPLFAMPIHNNVVLVGARTRTGAVTGLSTGISVVSAPAGTVFHNTVLAGDAALRIHNRGVPVENNVLIPSEGPADAACVQTYAIDPTDDASGFALNNNDLFGCSSLYTKTDAGTASTLHANLAELNGFSYASGNVSIDPELVDAANGNLRLSSSAANLDVRGGGKQLGTPLADINGTTRTSNTPTGMSNEGAYGWSMGAYEVD